MQSRSPDLGKLIGVMPTDSTFAARRNDREFGFSLQQLSKKLHQLPQEAKWEATLVCVAPSGLPALK